MDRKGQIRQLRIEALLGSSKNHCGTKRSGVVSNAPDRIVHLMFRQLRIERRCSKVAEQLDKKGRKIMGTCKTTFVPLFPRLPRRKPDVPEFLRHFETKKRDPGPK